MKNLESHPQNTNNSMLRMMTGGNDDYIAGNGMIFKKIQTQNNQQNFHQQRLPEQHRFQAQAFQKPSPNQQFYAPSHSQPQTYTPYPPHTSRQFQPQKPDSRPQSNPQPHQKVPTSLHFTQ